MKLTERLLHSWDAFKNAGTTYSMDIGTGSSTPSGKTVLSRISADSLAGTIYNRIAIDASMVTFHHVKTDAQGNETDIKSSMNDIFGLEANIDQNSVDFIQDIVYSMFDEGVVAVVPVHTTISPENFGGFEIDSMRVGKVTQWYPKPAVFDKDGWHEFPYLDMGEFYSEYADYTVSITIPSNLIIGATGVLQSKEELDQYKSIGRKNTENKTGKPALYQPNKTAIKTLTYTAQHVPDFAWFAAPDAAAGR